MLSLKRFASFFFIVNRVRTRIAFPSVLTVKVTKEISSRKNFNGQILSGRMDEVLKKNPKLIGVIVP